MTFYKTIMAGLLLATATHACAYDIINETKMKFDIGIEKGWRYDDLGVMDPMPGTFYINLKGVNRYALFLRTESYKYSYVNIVRIPYEKTQCYPDASRCEFFKGGVIVR